DEIRNRGSAAAAPAPYDAGLYTPAARAEVYEMLGAEAEAALAAGHGVVADATFLRAADRRRLAAAARRERRACVFVECRAPESVVRARLASRETEPALSDARWSTYYRRGRCAGAGGGLPSALAMAAGTRHERRVTARGASGTAEFMALFRALESVRRP